jgi:hypothetical protein
MKNLITLLLIIIPSFLFGQVKVYNDASNNFVVEYSGANKKVYTAGSDLLVFKNDDRVNVFSAEQSAICNIRFDSIKNESGTQLATTVDATIDSISLYISNANSTGEANTGSNVGTGEGVFSAKLADDLQFKSLISSNNEIDIVGTANEIDLNINDVGTGWVAYSDDQYTTSNRFELIENGFQNLPNNKADSISTYIPPGVTTFYNGGLITPENIGDAYSISVRLVAVPVNNTDQEILLRIILSDNTTIYEDVKVLPKGTGVEHFVSFSVIVYSLDTFVADGATVQVRAAGGSLDLYDITYLITRTHKAR